MPKREKIASTRQRHRIEIVSGNYSVHRVSPGYSELFMPRCLTDSCMWEGAWTEQRIAAERQGDDHVAKPWVP